MQGYESKEPAYLRCKAVKLYEALEKRKPLWNLVMHRLDKFDLAMQNLTACFWRAQAGRKSASISVGRESWRKLLMETLKFPYFFPNFDEFELGSNHRLKYTSLDNGQKQIRLLAILPSLDIHTEIRCRLTTVSLDDAHKYVALSYVWGNPEFREDIHIDGAVFPVAQNLLTSLRYLRCRQESKVLHFWVDAICIDQDNVSEKTYQISLMRDIYSRAQEVFLHLVDDYKFDGLAVEDRERIATFLSSAFDNEESYSKFKSLGIEIS